MTDKRIEMLDQYGREIEYLRISVTDRCNFRCVYCMPEEGVEQMTHDDILRYDEIVRTAGLLTQLGIKKIKVTGGEPLVRKGICSLISELKSLPEIEQVTLTTNGYQLEEMAEDLHDAGIDAVNISLDTLCSDEFKKITRADGLDSVLRGIDSMLKYPDVRVKINVVPIADYLSVASLAETRPVDVRFIEMMPIGPAKSCAGATESEILKALTEKYGEPTILSDVHGNGPGKYMHFGGMTGNIGFISAMSDRFCDKCNRIRLTSDGYLKQCLHVSGGTDLKGLIRSGASDDKLLETMRSVIYNKPEGHRFGTDTNIGPDGRCMNSIGG